MRIQSNRPRSFHEWHNWFAWHPVRIDSSIVWLEKVDRKYQYVYDGWNIEYRFPEKE